MNFFSFLFSPVAEALGHTILMSLWQSFIVFICLRLILKSIPNASARVKYLLSYFAYSTIALWFVVTFIRQFSILKNEMFFQEITSQSSFRQIQYHPAISSGFGGFSFSIFDNYLPVITAFYFFGILWFGARLFLNYFQTNRLKTQALTDLDTKWQQRVWQLATQINIQKKVQAYFSRSIETPMMIGFLKPVILLPLATMNHLSVQQFEAILIHELAHIRRNDYLFNLLQSVLDTILFFNPFTWWISKNIRNEREKCCDEMVLELSDPYHYARALLILEEPLRKHSLIMTAVGKHEQLLQRIKNIIEMKRNRINPRQKFITLLIIITATISVAWLSPKENKTLRAESPLPAKVSFWMAGTGELPVFGINNFLFHSPADTIPALVAPVPPRPPKDASVLVPPVPPVTPVAPNTSVVPTPPLPPIPPLPPMDKMKDTLSPLMNSQSKELEALNKSTEAMQKYFQSNAWKKQQEMIRKNSLEMKKYFNSDAWKKQQKEIQKNAIAMQQYFNSPKWKKQQEEIKHSTDSLMKYFKSDAWKKQQEEIQKNTKHMQDYFNSPAWKKQQELIRRSADSVTAYFKSDAWKKLQENLQKAIAQSKKFFESAEWKKQQEEFKKIAEENAKMWKESFPENKK